MVDRCCRGLLSAVALAAGLSLLAGCSGTPQKPASVKRSSCQPGGVWNVRAGDTLGEIALRCRVPLKLLARHNRIDPPYMIRIGQRIRIPDARTRQRLTRPKPRKMLPVIALRAPISGSRRWVDDGKGHHAAFYPASIGQPVRAAASGKVVAVTELPFYGRVVLVEHEKGYITVYAYLLRAQVKVGQRVRAGQVLARSGVNPQTGEPGLYFELRHGKRQVDLRRWRHWAG